MSFKAVDPTKTLQQLEDETIQYWKENKTFEKSVESKPRDNTYTFVDGPPFVSGMPHYGHLMTSIAKDLVPRYWTMKGKRVRRVWGWDCHGLPIENKVNQKLKIKSASEIEERVGIDKYIEECRNYVSSYSADWRWYIDKIGRWADLDNAYYTMSTHYMESVIWAFRQIYDKGLIYKGKRVSLFSTDTSTPVSNFEVQMDPDNYADTQDLAIFTKFELEDASRIVDTQGKPAYLIAWTTTPWTIPSNVALAVNKSYTYAVVEYENQILIVAMDRLAYTFNEDEGHIGTEEGKVVRILKEVKGTELEGFSYKPVYDFFVADKTDNDFKVYLSDDVVNTEGTGVLHIAPAFGEVDFQMGKKHNLSAPADIDQEGLLTVGPWTGVYLRQASPAITENLQEKGNLLRSEMYTHRLPYYRGDNPLIYMAQDAWFIDIQKMKDRMLELGEDINWVPEHVKENRWKHTLSTSPDWCISRNRYWLTIMPVWQAEDGEELVVGSIEEMTQFTDQITRKEENGKITYWFGERPMDLHRDVCDKIILTKNGKQFKRIPEVLDNWMDSGSAPFAEYHYPFENKDTFEKSMPADYIIEYVGQVRAWFNVLHRVSTMLFDRRCFTNVICHGVLAGNDGRKMSKTYGNYPDPKMVLEKYGADAVRLYFTTNPIFLGEDMNINENDIADQVKSVLNILWNSYKYFSTYAIANNFEGKPDKALGDTPWISEPEDTFLDKWIKTRLKETAYEISTGLDNYNIPQAARTIRPFVDDLSTWYIRRSRNRFVSGDKHALSTLFRILVGFSRVAAPIIPFITESMYRNLTGEESVHLANYPATKALTDEEKKLLECMAVTRQISSLGQAARLQAKQPIKQPLQTVQLKTENSAELPDEYLEIIKEELNVKLATFVDTVDNSFVTVEERGITLGLDTTLNEDLLLEGKLREVLRGLQEERKNAGLQVADEVELHWFSNDETIGKVFEKFAQQIKTNIKASALIRESSEDGLIKLEKTNLAVTLKR